MTAAVITLVAATLLATTRAGRTAVGRAEAAAVRGLVAVLRGYQTYVSPAFPPVCRFYPSCSAYAVEALRTHGLVRGVGLTTWRLLRCHPWHPGGVDPVPAPRAARTPHTRTAEDHHEEQAPC